MIRSNHLNIIIFTLLTYAPLLSAQEIKWISFDSLEQNFRKEPRPILIFIHTEWCKFCSLQDHNTFKNIEVTHILNQTYYCLRLNAELSEPITFLNREYQPSDPNGYHELAEFLGKEMGSLNFPTTIILSGSMTLKHRFSGFVDTDTLIKTLEGH